MNRAPVQQEMISNIQPPTEKQLLLDQTSAQNPTINAGNPAEMDNEMNLTENTTSQAETETAENSAAPGQQITATYSLEDNKIRLYATERLEPDLYKRVNEAGFKWAPMQKLFYAPMWTPAREALALELAGEIENEDVTLEERAAERAESFENYSAKRGRDANDAADYSDRLSEPFKNGQPILIGHHSQRKAEKLRDKVQNAMKKAVAFYDQSNYWADRSAGVRSNVDYKQAPRVRINRIKGFESDLRKQNKAIAESKEKIEAMQAGKITEANKNTVFGSYKWSFRLILSAEDEQTYNVPSYKDSNGYRSAYDLTKPEYNYPLDKIIARLIPMLERDVLHHQKWADHYTMRISFENQMLEASGHKMPDFKAISAEKRKKTTSKPIINTDTKATHVNHWKTTLNVFTITKEQFKKLSAREHIAVYRSACGTYRLRVCMNLWLKDYGLKYGPNQEHSSHAIFIKDQKRVEVPTQTTEKEA